MSPNPFIKPKPPINLNINILSYPNPKNKYEQALRAILVYSNSRFTDSLRIVDASQGTPIFDSRDEINMIAKNIESIKNQISQFVPPFDNIEHIITKIIQSKKPSNYELITYNKYRPFVTNYNKIVRISEKYFQKGTLFI